MAQKVWLGDDSGNEGNYGTAANWSPSGVPTTSDDVRIPATSTQSITAGLDQSAVAIGDFIVEEGYTGTIGVDSSQTYLEIDPNRFEFSGKGTAYIDIGSAAIDVIVKDTANATRGKRGLYLLGSGIDDLSVLKGKVGIAVHHGEAAVLADVRVLKPGADVICGEGSTITNGTVSGGSLEIRGSTGATLLECYSGKLITDEEGAVVTINALGGSCELNSIGTITTLNIDNGSIVDMMGSGIPRTVTTLVIDNGALIHDPDVITFTNKNAPATPVRWSQTPV